MVVIFRVNRRLIFYKISLVFSSVILLLFLLHLFEASYNLLHPPEMRCSENEPIDVVYTWVNGTDPKFLEDLSFFLRSKFDSLDSSKQRFDDKYELKFSLRSLEKFAPWVNHVYIVTNGQIPYWLNLEYEKVSVVTHEEIFKDEFNLPSFSSPAIECNLHRIPGLSKRFIYFNDDIFLGSPVYLEDFYSPNKGFLVYLAWPVPMCAPNCPWMYVNDGQCDSSCFNPECQLDGGDCDSNNEKRSLPNLSTEDNEIIKLDYHSTNYVKIKSSQNEYKNFTNKLVPKIYNATMLLKRNYFMNLINYNLRSNVTHVVSEHNKKILASDKLNRNQVKRKYKRKNRANSSALIKNLQPKLNIDAYSASLQFTNRIFNSQYGFKSRKVPSHAPIMIDKDIMGRLQEKFSKEFATTEGNRIRKSNDVQFSFSYYYFLMSEKYKRNVGDIFDEYDTDLSGTWSDREIRTILTKLYELPLTYAIVDHFEDILLNCSEIGEFSEVSTPPYERYIDSRLPTISKELVTNCDGLSEILHRFENVSKYNYEVLHNAESKYVTFKMLNSNISDVVRHLDDIRSNFKKFICLNDNLDEAKTNENELVKSVLYDFYFSLFPQPSKFELPKEYRNKFLYVNDLNQWKNHHFKLKIFVYCLCVAFMYCTFYNMCKRKLCQFVNKLFCCFCGFYSIINH